MTLRLKLLGSMRNPFVVTARAQSTSILSDQLSQGTVQPFSEVPSPPAWPVIGHLPLLYKGQAKLDKAFEKLRVDYGDIFKVHSPGQGDMVVLYKPEDIKCEL